MVEVETAHLSEYFQKPLASLLNVYSKITISSSQLEKLSRTRICQIVKWIVNKKKFQKVSLKWRIKRISFVACLQYFPKRCQRFILLGHLSVLMNIQKKKPEKWYYKEAWKSYTDLDLNKSELLTTGLPGISSSWHVRVALLFDAVHVSAANGSKCTIKYEYLALDRLFFTM